MLLLQLCRLFFFFSLLVETLTCRSMDDTRSWGISGYVLASSAPLLWWLLFVLASSAQEVPTMVPSISPLRFLFNISKFCKRSWYFCYKEMTQHINARRRILHQIKVVG